MRPVDNQLDATVVVAAASCFPARPPRGRVIARQAYLARRRRNSNRVDVPNSDRRLKITRRDAEAPVRADANRAARHHRCCPPARTDRLPAAHRVISPDQVLEIVLPINSEIIPRACTRPHAESADPRTYPARRPDRPTAARPNNATAPQVRYQPTRWLEVQTRSTPPAASVTSSRHGRGPSPGARRCDYGADPAGGASAGMTHPAACRPSSSATRTSWARPTMLRSGLPTISRSLFG